MLTPKIAPVIFVALSAYAQADAGRTDWVATPARAYAAMPATSLTDGKVGSVSWSPDGEHLLVAERPITTSREELLRFDGHTPTFGSLELIGWDRRFHQVKRLWSTEDASATIDSINWLKGTTLALATVRWVVRDGAQGAQHPLYGVLALDAASGKYRWVPGMEQLVARPDIYPSPTRATAAAVFSDNPQDGHPAPMTITNAITSALSELTFTLSGDDQAIAVGNGNVLLVSQPLPPANNFWTLDAGGGVLHAIKVEKPIQFPLVWNAEGSAWFLVQTDEKTQKRVLAHLTDQGLLEPTSESEFAGKEPQPDLTVSNGSATSKHGKSEVSYTNIWLNSKSPVDHGELMLAADGEWPELSPTCGGVFYIDGGVAKVRELIPLSPDQQRAAHDKPKTVELATAAGSVIQVFFKTAARSAPPQP